MRRPIGRKAVLYATCFVNYNKPGHRRACSALLAKNGVATEVALSACCGMPQLEQGDDRTGRRHAPRSCAKAAG